MRKLIIIKNYEFMQNITSLYVILFCCTRVARYNIIEASKQNREGIYVV